MPGIPARLAVPGLLLAVLASGCGAATARRAGPPPATAVPATPAAEVGIASWYGREHHGRRTASGERFDMSALTAAHPAMPFGTRVRVTHLASGRSVIVRINDRGPFRGGRILDLSRAAAERLGMIATGTARVRVEVVGTIAGGDTR